MYRSNSDRNREFKWSRLLRDKKSINNLDVQFSKPTTNHLDFQICRPAEILLSTGINGHMKTSPNNLFEKGNTVGKEIYFLLLV
jgi:hypothetical protein